MTQRIFAICHRASEARIGAAALAAAAATFAPALLPSSFNTPSRADGGATCNYEHNIAPPRQT